MRELVRCCAAAAAVFAIACHTSPQPVLETVPALPQQQISPPVEATTTSVQPSAQTTAASPSDTAAEVHVSIDTRGAEIDVRQALSYLAEQGRMSLVFSPGIEKKVRLQLHDVPVSVALRAVLAAADLTLESTDSAAPPPPSASVVFYQLPVNVDSLSVEAIMKRFGVGRTVAEMIVQGRVAKP